MAKPRSKSGTDKKEVANSTSRIIPLTRSPDPDQFNAADNSRLLLGLSPPDREQLQAGGYFSERFLARVQEVAAASGKTNPSITPPTEKSGELDLSYFTLPELTTPTNAISSLLNQLAVLIEKDPRASVIVKNHPIFNKLAAGKRKDFLPTVPAEQWAKRPRESRETCIDFAERVYKDCLPKGMVLSDLTSLDHPLYMALYKWLERNRDAKMSKQRAAFLIGGKSTRSKRVQEELRELGIKNPSDAYRVLPDDRKRANRLYQAARRAQRL